MYGHALQVRTVDNGPTAVPLPGQYPIAGGWCRHQDHRRVDPGPAPWSDAQPEAVPEPQGAASRQAAAAASAAPTRGPTFGADTCQSTAGQDQEQNTDQVLRSVCFPDHSTAEAACRCRRQQAHRAARPHGDGTARGGTARGGTQPRRAAGPVAGPAACAAKGGGKGGPPGAELARDGAQDLPPAVRKDLAAQVQARWVPWGRAAVGRGHHPLDVSSAAHGRTDGRFVGGTGPLRGPARRSDDESRTHTCHWVAPNGVFG
jgi:hypothetical protein